MARPTPYTYIQCPCSDQSALDESDASSPRRQAADEDERTFDPRAPRSNFSLYPLEYLLYCEDCQQIRCPRCVSEEIVTYYCPNCLFEVPSSNLRSEGNRCTRSCYQCPVCIGPLQVAPTQLGPENNAGTAGAQANSAGGPFALICQYCNWSSREIAVEFERSGGLYSQLAKMKNGGGTKPTFKDVKERRKEYPDEPPLPDSELDHDLQFSSLRYFYQEQLADVRASLGGLPLPDGIGFSSPANLSRIMSLYTGRGGHQGKMPKGLSDVVREALNTDEGLKLEQLDQSIAIKKLMHGGWDATNSRKQRDAQLEPALRFQEQLRPIPYLLRTKRSKRCPVCRHIISKPENKVTSTRFKIRLVAKSYMPTITIRPLHPTATPTPVGYRPGDAQEAPLTPMKPYQYLLTFKNPLFDSIKVTLGAPSTTPGRFPSRVTVLCPQFEVNANTDMWDDALKEDGRESSRKADDNLGQGEAGKIWERGRNWVSIVLEVIPASLRPEHQSGPSQDNKASGDPLGEDEDILEVPMFVRVEWEADAHHDMATSVDRDRDTKEKRELAYWCVLGIGRINNE